MKEFSRFLEDIKQNRDSEIRSVISKGYSCNAKYKFFDYFTIEWFEQKFEMSFFTNNSETNFLVVEDSIDVEASEVKKRSKYYSMLELFDSIIKYDSDRLLFKAISSPSRTHIKLYYKSNVYLMEIPEFSKRSINKTKKENYSLLTLLLTFFLIQNKSNCIFKNTGDYIDGIYRFFIVYSTIKTDVNAMERRGWFYIDGKFNYKPYLEMRLIRLVYKDKKMLKEENEFSKQLSSDLSNDDALLLFIKEYNRLYGTNITKDDISNDESLFFTKSNSLDSKEASGCDSLKPYNPNNNDRCFRLKGIAIGVNVIAHHFMISKFNKKYYLTSNELNEIINNDPSESSIDDRSEGSNSF